MYKIILLIYVCTFNKKNLDRRQTFHFPYVEISLNYTKTRQFTTFFFCSLGRIKRSKKAEEEYSKDPQFKYQISDCRLSSIFKKFWEGWPLNGWIDLFKNDMIVQTSRIELKKIGFFFDFNQCGDVVLNNPAILRCVKLRSQTALFARYCSFWANTCCMRKIADESIIWKENYKQIYYNHLPNTNTNYVCQPFLSQH